MAVLREACPLLAVRTQTGMQDSVTRGTSCWQSAPRKALGPADCMWDPCGGSGWGSCLRLCSYLGCMLAQHVVMRPVLSWPPGEASASTGHTPEGSGQMWTPRVTPILQREK